MRTTITIPDNLLEELKRRASERRTSVSELIKEAVDSMLTAPRSPQTSLRFRLVTYGRGGRFTQRNVDRTAELTGEEDLARYKR